MVKFKTIKKSGLVIILAASAIFSALKLAGFVDMTWFWALFPIIAYGCLAIIVLIIYLILKLLVPKFE